MPLFCQQHSESASELLERRPTRNMKRSTLDIIALMEEDAGLGAGLGGGGKGALLLLVAALFCEEQKLKSE